MPWKFEWFGRDRPSWSRVVAIAALFANLPLMLLALAVSWLPASGLRGLPGAMLFGIAGICVAMIFVSLATRRRKGRFAATASTGTFMLWMTSMAFAASIWAWLVPGTALPWMYARVFGAENRIRTEVSTGFTRSSKSCDYYVRGGAIEAGGLSKVCVSEALYVAHPQRRIVVDLTGRRTALGFAITEVYLVREADVSTAARSDSTNRF